MPGWGWEGFCMAGEAWKDRVRNGRVRYGLAGTVSRGNVGYGQVSIGKAGKVG